MAKTNDSNKIKMNKPIVKSTTAQITIQNFPELKQRAIDIDKAFIKMSKDRETYNHRDFYQSRRLLNRLNRGLNSLRLKHKRVYMKPYKRFKAQVDEIRSYISDASKRMSDCLDDEKKAKIQELKKRLAPKMKEICDVRHIKPLNIPKEALKLSESNSQRIDAMVGVAENEKIKNQLKIAKPKGHKAMLPNGKSVGIAQHLLFMGGSLQLSELLHFAKQHHIYLKKQ